MTLDANWPEVLDLPGPAGPERAMRAGPSMHGCIYRVSSGSAWYRLLRIDRIPLQRRQQIQAWIRRQPLPGLARLTHAQQVANDEGYYVYYALRYETQASDRTLADFLGEPDFFVRLECVIGALQALPTWWEQAGCPLLPLPSDIVFTEDGAAILLALPTWPLPGVGAVFAVPERGLYLAPELVRGQKCQHDEALDRYALGVALVQCFVMPADCLLPETILRKVAAGTVFEPDSVISVTPYWLDGVAAFHRALALARRQVHTEPRARTSTPVPGLVEQLELLRQRMAPLVAAQDLRSAQKPRTAMSLVQDMLLEQHVYELLLLAGEIAGFDLHRPTEAIDFLERAIAASPSRSDAYLAQFRVLTGKRNQERLAPLVKGNPSVARQLDERVERDYGALPRGEQNRHETDVASYLMWRGQYVKAASFIYDRLYEGNQHLWWKFDLNLWYAEALLAQGRFEDAQAQLQSVDAGLAKARENDTISDRALVWHGRRLIELVERLHALRR